jgi:hypothetical protein
MEEEKEGRKEGSKEARKEGGRKEEARQGHDHTMQRPGLLDIALQSGPPSGSLHTWAAFFDSPSLVGPLLPPATALQG